MLEKVKHKLCITWDDDSTNTRLNDIISNGKITLNNYLGITSSDFSYETNSQEMELLLNYCLYSYNNCLDDFFSSYGQEIRTLRIKHLVEDYTDDTDEENE